MGRGKLSDVRSPVCQRLISGPPKHKGTSPILCTTAAQQQPSIKEAGSTLPWFETASIRSPWPLQLVPPRDITRDSTTQPRHPVASHVTHSNIIATRISAPDTLAHTRQRARWPDYSIEMSEACMTWSRVTARGGLSVWTRGMTLRLSYYVAAGQLLYI